MRPTCFLHQNILLLVTLLLGLAACAPRSTPVAPTITGGASPQVDSWGGIDALGRQLPAADSTGPPRSGKYVGIFYFAWLGAHGHDRHTPPLPDEGVHPKTAADTLSPYDISKLLARDSLAPDYGPDKAFHHWGEPYFGYYLSDDEWVIAKHAQLLADAAVDVIVFDITNGLIYLPQVLKVCQIFTALQAQGWAVPKIAFLTNSKHVETTQRIYAGLYAPGHYADLWFRWKGKPLLMGNPEGLPAAILDFFTIRRSWAWTEGQEWFGDGRDKWPWLDHYPQNYGWHEHPEQPEQIVVASAQHPISNIGRSFHRGRQPPPDSVQSGQGWFFAEQWQRALEVDPEFIFITGWNEWVAMRFQDGRAKQMMGQPIATGDTYFVDQYNAEFSRDIEPMRGGFGDNYYYQMVSNIRRFKGSRSIPTDRQRTAIRIDGRFDDWQGASARYTDHTGDIRHRDHPGWGNSGTYRDRSGRHDLVEARVARTTSAYCFYVRTDTPFASAGWPTGLQLLLRVAADTSAPDWEGFHYLVEREGAAVTLKRSLGGWRWENLGPLQAQVRGSELELAVPASYFPPSSRTLGVKWLDNVNPAGDIMRCYDRGDAAPNARYFYRYTFE